MASLIWWTWVWVNSRSWWWTRRPGMLWLMGLQGVGHDWATELNWTELNLYSRFLMFAFFLKNQFCTFKSPIFSTRFYLGMWLLARLLSPPFDSPFSPPSHLYLLPPHSLLYLTLWISFSILGSGEHLGNWLLARSVSFILMPPLLKEMGTSKHLTCLLRNLYAGQEATVRMGHGATDWFQIGKVVRQVCALSPGLFNLYAEISITSDMQRTPPLWQKVKKN